MAVGFDLRQLQILDGQVLLLLQQHHRLPGPLGSVDHDPSLLLGVRRRKEVLLTSAELLAIVVTPLQFVVVLQRLADGALDLPILVRARPTCFLYLLDANDSCRRQFGWVLPASLC